ncbi:MAG: hypothetical protein WDN67_03505 [Candidatus Moraniibacteriota bacterium]
MKSTKVKTGDKPLVIDDKTFSRQISEELRTFFSKHFQIQQALREKKFRKLALLLEREIENLQEKQGNLKNWQHPHIASTEKTVAVERLQNVADAILAAQAVLRKIRAR